MESEVNEFVVAIGAPVAEKVTNVDEVLLPTDGVSTNGISNLTTSGTLNYLTEVNDIVQEEDSGEEIEAHDKDDDIEEEGEEEEVDADVDAEIDNEEAEEDDYEEIEGERENLVTQKECAQVPKKRKFAPSTDANAESVGDGEIEGEDEYEEDEEDEGEEIDDDENKEEEAVLPDIPSMETICDDELPTSSARAAANKENTVDEDSCRVCTTKEDLVSLFKHVEGQMVSELLMLICPSVSIARKDFMPQYVCQRCFDNITIAVQVKTQCENTERELRKKLSRHKNKVRRPSGYVVIDAPVESDPEEEEEEPADDVEFKVSDEEVSASADESDTDDSDFGSKRKRGGGGKRGRRKSSMGGMPFKEKRPKGRPPKRTRSSDDEFVVEKRKKDPISGDTLEFPCDECDQVFTRKLSLVLHKKTHSQSDPIICNLCGKHFKIKGAYRTHMERHKTETSTFSCSRCDLFFTSKTELKKHQAEEHNQLREPNLSCYHCKRSFVSEARLQRHLENYCPASEQAQKHRKSDYTEHSSTGKDLFKTVAPLTTTYWSDSFSD